MEYGLFVDEDVKGNVSSQWSLCCYNDLCGEHGGDDTV